MKVIEFSRQQEKNSFSLSSTKIMILMMINLLINVTAELNEFFF